MLFNNLPLIQTGTFIFQRDVRDLWPLWGELFVTDVQTAWRVTVSACMSDASAAVAVGMVFPVVSRVEPGANVSIAIILF